MLTPRLILRLAAGFILLAGAVAVLVLALLRGDAIGEAERMSGWMVQVVEEQSTRTIQAAEATLELGVARIAALRAAGTLDEKSARAMLRELLTSRPFLRAIWVLDAEGRIALDSDEGNIGINLADRGYFRTHRDRPDSRLEIGNPVLSRSTGTWFVSLSRPVRDADGRFQGVIAAALEPPYFDAIWRHINLGRYGTIGLFRRDGALMVRTPYDAATMGRSYPQARFVPLVAAAPAGTYTGNSLIDRRERVVSYRSLSAYPELLVVVGLSTDIVLAGWQRAAALSFVAWLAASLAVGFAAYRLRREAAMRLKSGEALRVEQQRAGAIMDHTVDGLVTFDLSGRILSLNPAAERMFGYGVDAAVGQNVRMLLPEPYRSTDGAELAAQLRAGAAVSIGIAREIEGLRQDGSTFPMDVAIGEIPPLADGRRQFVGTLRDLTARKATEAQLRQAQKMEAVGQLTGGVAHDFNNLLSVIIGNLELLAERGLNDTTRSRLLDPALRAALRGAELTHRLLAFSRRQALQPAPTDIAEVLDSLRDLLARTLGETVALEFIVAPGLLPCMVDRSQLENAILNLAINARDAMPGGGRIVIEASHAVIGEDRAGPELEIAAGRYVLLSFSDNGIGMSEATRQRAFEPFFTTKGVGKGSGLGLSMVFGFVKQSGGHISIYSELGSGTTIKLFLPIADQAAPPPADAGAAGETAAPTGRTVLVVEDQVDVRAVAVAQFERLGWRAIEAGNAREALGLIDADGAIDLLFVDVVLPDGMSGAELAVEAVRRRPGLKLLYTSGYTENAILHHGRLDPGVLLVSKPYQRRDLAEMVRRAMQSE